ncbi:hypothetical protein M378DRAFT_106698 [Amanita muscaria Koide BX008]|uniref:Uncharacterized protein n=1 Tax=Amanita muscaria (strain Koide BX008) TaxID=946122 RepID=A0A0C2TBH8_AMAMK|nr:hypothetical protein M378DRAFT_106698 [Amanita muscaria Koide BX008]
MPAATYRERRAWTAKEDQLLRDAVEREDPNNPNPSKWHAIAKHVPNRTNKDCRKRWFAKMASDVVKGAWSPEEDERLVKGIELFGTRWSQVASIVQTRNSDQCAKRWTDTLNPSIDRTMWTPDADELLLKAVTEHGKVWAKIVKTYFPGRTGLSAKNRYNSITRFSTDPSRGRTRRKTPEDSRHGLDMKSRSVSPTSSGSFSGSGTPSPITPSMSISNIAALTAFQHNSFDDFSGWPATPMEGSYSQALSNHGNTVQNCGSTQRGPLLEPQIFDASFSSFDNSLNHPYLQFSSASMMLATDATLQQSPLSSQPQSPMYPLGVQDEVPMYSQVSVPNDLSGQFSMVNLETDPFMGLDWSAHSQEAKHNEKFTLPVANENFFMF